MKRELFIRTIGSVFIFLFVYAAVIKLLEFQKFRAQLGQSPVLTGISEVVAIGIPTLEIAIAALLAIPRYRLVGLYASFSLMMMFSTYIILITSFSTYVPCSCGGVLQNMSWSQHLVFNLFMVLLGVIGVLLSSSINNSSTHRSRALINPQNHKSLLQ